MFPKKQVLLKQKIKPPILYSDENIASNSFYSFRITIFVSNASVQWKQQHEKPIVTVN